jgi:hypothetical protein
MTLVSAPPPKTAVMKCHVCGQFVPATKQFGWPWVLEIHIAIGQECRGSRQAATQSAIQSQQATQSQQGGAA